MTTVPAMRSPRRLFSGDETTSAISTKSKPKRKLKLSNKSIYGYGNLDINDLTSIEKIDYYLQLMLNEVGSDEGKRDEYFIKETHHYVDILPEEFYSEYSKWMQVGWALKN
ncbi:MAG: hypothetical protein CL499_03130, partial [Actinobacteria bacterium]|nr:hypothetical protein [Actinomycetota bacterium]